MALVVVSLSATERVAAQAYGQTGAQPQPYGQRSAPPYGQQQPGDFHSGGLAPPSPMGTDPAQPQQDYESETERRLTEAERRDSGRGLDWIYFDVEAGYEHLGLESLSGDSLTYGEVQSSSGGLMLGVGGGIRLIFVTLGGRARVGMFDQWNVVTINGQGGFHIPIGSVEPYFTFGGGYAFLTSLDAKAWGGDPSVSGWNLRGGFGVDYYVTPVFSVGGNLTGEALFLKRASISLASVATQFSTEARNRAKSTQSSVGAAFTASTVLALHF